MATLCVSLLMLVKFLSLAVALPFGAAWSGNEAPAGQELVLGPVSSCPASTPVSCTNTTVQPDLCCFEAPSVSAVQGDCTTVLMAGNSGPINTDPGESPL